MINYKELLEEHDSDAYMLETHESPITKDSAVCISPFNTKTNVWLYGMNFIIIMAEVLNERLPIVTKEEDTELRGFLDINYPKEI